MRVIFMDLSKRSAGFAAWGPEDARINSGAWELGSELTSQGRTFCRLHERLSDLHAITPIDALFFERPLNLGPHAGNTNAETIEVLIGLAAHALSWAEAIGCRHAMAVNMAAWRRFFIGKMPRATKGAELKGKAMARCRQLGFKPRTYDEAEAIGGLAWACDYLGVPAPWLTAPKLPLERFEPNPFEKALA